MVKKSKEVVVRHFSIQSYLHEDPIININKSFFDLSNSKQIDQIHLLNTDYKETINNRSLIKEEKLKAREWSLNLNTHVLEHFQKQKMEAALVPLNNSGMTPDGYLWSDIHNDNYIMRSSEDKKQEMKRIKDACES